MPKLMKITKKLLNGQPLVLTCDGYFSNGHWAIKVSSASCQLPYIDRGWYASEAWSEVCINNRTPLKQLNVLYRSQGTEVDLLSDLDGSRLWAVETFYLTRLMTCWSYAFGSDPKDPVGFASVGNAGSKIPEAFCGTKPVLTNTRQQFQLIGPLIKDLI